MEPIYLLLVLVTVCRTLLSTDSYRELCLSQPRKTMKRRSRSEEGMRKGQSEFSTVSVAGGRR